MKLSIEKSIARLQIEGRTYHVCPGYFGPARFAASKSGASGDVKIVGEALIKNEKYLIVQHTAEAKNNAAETKPVTHVLTKRELQIAMLVAEGKANKQIAAQLKISEWTVSTHLRRTFAKLGVDTRAAMVFRYSQHFGPR